MAFTVTCPACGASFKAPDALMDSAILCPQCRRLLQVDSADDGRRLSSMPVRLTVVAPPREPVLEIAVCNAPGARTPLGEARDRWAGLRWNALDRVRGPALFLNMAGVAITAAGVLFLWTFLGFAIQVADSPAFVGPQTSVLNAVLGTLGVSLVIVGPVVFLAGRRLRQLRSYKLAMTATILASLTAMAICVPLALIGLYPFLVLLDSDVKWAFRGSELPPEE